ncbi:Mbov_0121 family peptidase domain-containing ABC transporter [Mycoplasmopsis cynos]|uniref:Cobalt transporter ATP-binding subunit n=2 Tax=Mycoplasmopsis cynos TaxID=171284 RepID=A0A449AI49_9BACT|nr:ATP-binding cassette domain-containing protein [Mycoplasmopsis cynos]VEU64660.1 cobalt transporter ATP-binding subunit [Mycoplasmopsis cynos]
MNKNEFKQIDQKDCSLYVFKYFLHYKEGINISIDELKLQTKYQVNGISLEDFNQSIMNQNWEIAVYNTDFDTLTKINDSEFPFAAIVNTFDENHMVLLTEFNAENIVYYDPNIGSEVCLKLNEFKKIFKEVLIEFKKRKTNIQSIKSSKDSINPKLTTNLSLWELHKSHLFLFFILLLELSFLILIPIINKRIINVITIYKLENELILIGISTIVVIIFLYLFQNIVNRITKRIYLKKSHQNIHLILTKFQVQNKKIINKFTSIEIKNRLSSLYEIVLLKETFIPNLLINILSFGISLIILRNINNIMLITLFVLGLVLVSVCLIQKRIFETHFNAILGQSYLMDQTFDNYINSINEFMQESLSSKTLIKWNEESKKFQEISFIYDQKLNYINTFNALLEIIIPLLIGFIGVSEIWNNRLEISNFIYFLTSLNLFLKPLKGFFINLSDYLNFKEKSKLINVFKENVYSNNLIDKILIDKIMKIQISYGEFTYFNTNKPAIDIDRLIFEDKSKILGINGSGKSTLSKIIAGLLPLDKGEILINDTSCNVFLNKDIKEKIYYLNSEQSMLKLTISEFLMINNNQHFYNILNKHNFLELFQMIKLDYKMLEWKRLNELSKGQIAFVKILKLLIYDFDVVILDEAFENISIEVFKMLKQRLNQYLKDKIVIEISHNNKYIFDSGKEVYLNA